MIRTIRMRGHPSDLRYTVRSSLYTLHLFTRADYKTILFPIATFGCVAGPLNSSSGFFQALLWIWLHLLQCNLSNQYKSRDEDLINKPWRPLPANRLTPKDAQKLRWIVAGACLGFSVILGRNLVWVSLALTITTILYDECGLAGHWLGKNISGVSGYSSFEAGSAILMKQSSALDEVAIRAMLFNGLLILTTLHAQDFADVKGDLQRGRSTFPISFPTLSRLVVSLGILLWSLFLCQQWGIGWICSSLFTAFGLWIAGRFWFLRSTGADKASYFYYNFWLLTALLLPVNARLRLLEY